MAGREELAALLFELQRARGPIEKARAAARAWRTLRELSPSERRMIAREIGASGADELLESLSGGGRGFSPAAVLEALTRVEDDDRASLDGIVADLRDPERRAEAILDMVDVAADVATSEGEPAREPVPDEGDDEVRDGAEFELPLPPVPVLEAPPASGRAPVGAAAVRFDVATTTFARDVRPVEPPRVLPAPLPAPHPPPPAPRVPSVWDEMLRRPVAAPTGIHGTPGVAPDRGAATGVRPPSVLRRLRELRDRRGELASSSLDDVRTCLDAFPEPWARRRALCFLLAEGIPADDADALELVADLQRPVDRRWCLGVLASRGGLVGPLRERALELLASPSARRRLARRLDPGP